MEVLFINARVKQLCHCFAELKDYLGPDGARAAAAQLASLRAASCLEEVRNLPGECSSRRGEFSLHLANGARIDFEPADQPVADGARDWSNIRSIRILRIGEG